MSRRLMLPLTGGDTAHGRPTVDTIRKRLGGRASTEPGAGEVVAFSIEGGAPRTGVVLFVRGDHLDVWLYGGLVRRLRRADTQAPDAVTPRALASIAIEARAFGDLREGQLVRYQHEGGLGEGTLVEKCRFGGLVERADGVVIAVGFRRLSAAIDHDRN